MKKLAYLVLFAACAGRAPAPLASKSPPPAEAPGYELQVLDYFGDTTRRISIERGWIHVGIAARAKNDARVVIVDPATSRQRTVFTPPLAIPGLPPDARGFDYFLPSTDSDEGMIHFEAHASSPSTIYTVRWALTWNSLRNTFDVSAPVIERRPVGTCEACDAG